MYQPKTYFYDNENEQARRLADEISQLLLRDIENRGRALLILPGGSSPRKLISLLAQLAIPWDRVQITVTDERCVSLDSENSNVGQIIRLFAEHGVSVAPVILSEKNVKSLNLPSTVTVLGMGLDGHIASLFPNQEWECEGRATIKATAPNKPKNRISLTMKTLMDTNHLILLVNRQDKWYICSEIMDNKEKDIPVGRLFHLAKDKLNLCVYIAK